MVVGLAGTHAQSILEVYRGTSYTGFVSPSVQLHTADPASAGTTAASVGDATKRAVTWNAATTGGSMTLATLGAYTNGGTSETISHISIWRASGATFVQSATLTASQAWVSTNTLTVTTLTLNFTPIAA